MITGIVNRDFEPIIPLSVYDADGLFNIYEAILVWDGELLNIAIDEADSEPLVGMSLMNGYQLVVQVFSGGLVELSKVTPV